MRVGAAQAHLSPDSAALPEAAHTVVSGTVREGEGASRAPPLLRSSSNLCISVVGSSCGFWWVLEVTESRSRRGGESWEAVKTWTCS